MLGSSFGGSPARRGSRCCWDQLKRFGISGWMRKIGKLPEDGIRAWGKSWRWLLDKMSKSDQ
jgi:hypothetical protein